MAEVILPGTYITVRDEGLISAGRVATGNIGIVGTAAKGIIDKVEIIGSFSEAKESFGEFGENLTLMRALEQIYNNGGKTVYAVRTAKNDHAKAAAYQTVDEKNVATALVKLEAKTPGTWGNEIKIKISPADGPSEVTEELKGDAKNLNRLHVIVDSGFNSITVKQKSTGYSLQYKIVYDKAPDKDQKEVKIDPNTGTLTFTTLKDYVPVQEDTIIARYQVPQANSKKVELRHQAVKETYIVADASHLAELVNQKSKLVTAPENAKSAFYNQLPKNTINESDPTDPKGEKLFGTGLDGHTAGANGEDAGPAEYTVSLVKLENDLINIVVLAGQDVSNAQMVTALMGHLNTTTENKRERIGIIGSNGKDDIDAIAGHSLNSERLIFVAPGLLVDQVKLLKLPGAYTAAAVAGLISALPVHTSPTNKVLNIPGLSTEFTASKLEKLVQNRVLAVEKRDGFRIVKGITTATNTAWHQITTRRIVDYAIYGVRSACDPYIGKLNNERVRGAMKATLDAFLTRMVGDEALISYEVAVTATRREEIDGYAMVTMTLRPTFSIDFIKVTMYLG